MYNIIADLSHEFPRNSLDKIDVLFAFDLSL